ncbi:MAG: DUF4215 domain-containing protein [Patescibacteria group bacterium]
MPKKKISLFVAINLLIYSSLLGVSVFWQADKTQNKELKANVLDIVNQEQTVSKNDSVWFSDITTKNTTAPATNEVKPVLVAATTAECGNGIVDGSDECDDGNDSEEDTCDNNCVLTSCGDDIVQSPNGQGESETCDSDVDGCDGCQAICGDGIVIGKECEPPNSDTCDASCQYKGLCDIEFPEYKVDEEFLDYSFDYNFEIDLPPELAVFLTDPVAYFKKMIPPSEPSPFMAKLTAKINYILKQVAMIKAYALYIGMKIGKVMAFVAKTIKKIEFLLASGLPIDIDKILSDLGAMMGGMCDDVDSMTEAAESMEDAASCSAASAVCEKDETIDCAYMKLDNWITEAVATCKDDCSDWDVHACGEVEVEGGGGGEEVVVEVTNGGPIDNPTASNDTSSAIATLDEEPKKINPQNLLAGILQIPSQKKQIAETKTSCSIMMASITPKLIALTSEVASSTSSSASDEEIEALLALLDEVSTSMENIQSTVDDAAAAAEEAGDTMTQQAEDDAAAEEEASEAAATEAQESADSTELTSEQPVVPIGLKNADKDGNIIYADLPDVIPIRPIKGSDIDDDEFKLKEDEVIVPSWNYGEIDINDTDPVDVDIISYPTN